MTNRKSWTHIFKCFVFCPLIFFMPGNIYDSSRTLGIITFAQPASSSLHFLRFMGLIGYTRTRWRRSSLLTGSLPWMLPTYLISGLPSTCRSGVDETASTHNSRPLRRDFCQIFFSFFFFYESDPIYLLQTCRYYRDASVLDNEALSS